MISGAMSSTKGAEQNLILTLPPELREKIYDFALAASPPPTTVIGAKRISTKVAVPSLTLASRQLRHDVLPSFFELQKLDMYLCLDTHLRQCKKQLDLWTSMDIAFGEVRFIGKDRWNDDHWRVCVRCIGPSDAAVGGLVVEATSGNGATRPPLAATVLREIEDQVRSFLAARPGGTRWLKVQNVRDIGQMLLEGAVERAPPEARWLTHWEL